MGDQPSMPTPCLAPPRDSDGPLSVSSGAPALGTANIQGALSESLVNKKSKPSSKQAQKGQMKGSVPPSKHDVNRENIMKNLEAVIASVSHASTPLEQDQMSEASINGPEEVHKRMKELELETQDDLAALSPDEEAAVAKEARKAEKGPLGEDEANDSDDDEEPPAKRSYAEATKSIRGYEVLYIHFGEKERRPIEKDLFYKLWDRVNQATYDTFQQTGQLMPDNILWRSWSKDRGLVAVGDKATSDYLCALIRTLKVKKASFRAWHRDEFSQGRLVTGFSTGQGHRKLSAEQVVTYLLAQNRLKGASMGATIKETEGGRLIRFFADPVLWNDLLSRRDNSKKRVVRLKLACTPFLAHLSREREDTPSNIGDAGSQEAQTGPGELGQAPPTAQEGS